LRGEFFDESGGAAELVGPLDPAVARHTNIWQQPASLHSNLAKCRLNERVLLPYPGIEQLDMRCPEPSANPGALLAATLGRCKRFELDESLVASCLDSTSESDALFYAALRKVLGVPG